MLNTITDSTRENIGRINLSAPDYKSVSSLSGFSIFRPNDNFQMSSYVHFRVFQDKIYHSFYHNVFSPSALAGGAL